MTGVSKRKEPAELLAAKANVDAKKQAMEEARNAVKEAEKSYYDAEKALSAARHDADASLPQARCVSVNRYSSKPSEVGNFVLLRKTPSGLLVTRRVGSPSDLQPIQFKWNTLACAYREKQRHVGFASSFLELRDVPAEFMPKEPSHA